MFFTKYDTDSPTARYKVNESVGDGKAFLEKNVCRIRPGTRKLERNLTYIVDESDRTAC